MITYMARSTFSRGQYQLLGLIDRLLGGTDRQQALLGVPAGPSRIGDAHDDAGDLEPPLRDLRVHEVRVVPAARGAEHVGLLDSGFDLPVDLERGPNREPTAGVLPR